MVDNQITSPEQVTSFNGQDPAEDQVDLIILTSDTELKSYQDEATTNSYRP